MNLQGRFYIRRAGLAAHTKRYRVSFQLGVEPWSCLDVMSLYFTYSTYLRGDKVQLSAGKLFYFLSAALFYVIYVYIQQRLHILKGISTNFSHQSLFTGPGES